MRLTVNGGGGGGGGSAGTPTTGQVPGARLTLTSATPITTTDVTAAGTLYYTPYLHGNIATYDSGAWSLHTFAELSLVLALTSGKNYDVFVDGNGVLSLSAAWTNDTTRADALASQDGVAVLGSDHSKRHIGTIRASGTNACEDSKAKRFVSNKYNGVTRDMLVTEATSSWTYDTNTWRAARGQATNCFEYVCCSLDRRLQADVEVAIQGAAVGFASGVGLDSTTVNSAQRRGVAAGTPLYFPSLATYAGFPGLGYHKITWLEIAYSGVSVTSYGSPDAAQVAGMAGEISG